MSLALGRRRLLVVVISWWSFSRGGDRRRCGCGHHRDRLLVISGLILAEPPWPFADLPPLHTSGHRFSTDSRTELPHAFCLH